jgi:hypothetical protein
MHGLVGSSVALGVVVGAVDGLGPDVSRSPLDTVRRDVVPTECAPTG